MPDVVHELASRGAVLTDGAWGTQLQALGLPIGDCPDAWNLLHPDLVEQVAAGYVDAGSRVILTNTFGASRIALDRYGLVGSASEINRTGVEISRRAAGACARVFASIGPTGKMLMAGEVTPEQVRAAFDEQAAAMAEGGADAILVETMSDPEEACLAIAAAIDAGLPVLASMVFDAGKNLDRTMTGATPERCAEALAAAGASAVGCNCGRGAEQMLPIVERLRAATGLPVWVKPNAGLPEVVGGKAVYATTPREFAVHALALVQAGASYIGACCGSSPEFVRALGAALEEGRTT